MTKCERCGDLVEDKEARHFTSMVQCVRVYMCRNCARIFGAMTPYEANQLAREVVQQVAQAQPGIPDEDDDFTVNAEQLEEIVFACLKDWIWGGTNDEAVLYLPTKPGHAAG